MEGEGDSEPRSPLVSSALSRGARDRTRYRVPPWPRSLCSLGPPQPTGGFIWGKIGNNFGTPDSGALWDSIRPGT